MRHCSLVPNTLLALMLAVLTACSGARTTTASCGTNAPRTANERPKRTALVLDGRVVDIVQRDARSDGQPAARSGDSRALDTVPVDSIVEITTIDDSAALARYQLCPGDEALVVITVAEARRRGLRAPPPALCLEAMESIAPLSMSLPVGVEQRARAGRLDILAECDLAPPTGVQWASSDTSILSVDSTGVAIGRAPGRAALIVSANGGVARETLTVVAPVARIVLAVVDTVMTVGDSITVQAVAVGRDGRRMPDVPLQLLVTDQRDDGTAPIFFEARTVGTRATANANSARIVARASGTGWIHAAMVGRSDSLQLRVVAQ